MFGVFDSDFARFGPSNALRRDGTCVCFAHFAKLRSARLGSRRSLAGMAEYTRPTPNSTDLVPVELDDTTRLTPAEGRRSILIEESPIVDADRREWKT